MALIRSTLLASISGSIAGATFARNAGGAYMRNRTKPVNPNSTNQQLARGSFTFATTSWRGISDANQLGWKVYAQNTPRVNRLGETIHLSGFGEYTKLNAFRAFLGQSLLSIPPDMYGAPDPMTVLNATIDSSLAQLSITAFTGSTTATNSQYAWWISNPLDDGQTFYKGPWTFLGTDPGDAGTPITHSVPFTIPVGKSFYIRVRFYDEHNRLSNEQIFGQYVSIA